MTVKKDIVSTNFSAYEISIGNVLEVDVLNCSSWLVANTLADTLVCHNLGLESTTLYKRGLLYDTFYILSNAFEVLNFEKVFDYFSIEMSFVSTNLKAIEIATKQDDALLLECCQNIMSLPYDDFVYVMNDELSMLPELAYALKTTESAKSLVNLILNSSRLRFTSEMIHKYRLISFLIVRYWVHLV